MRSSTDGGENFGDVTTAGDEIDLGVCWVGSARPQIRPSLAASANGSLFLVTCDRKDIQDPDPYLRLFRSTDDGASWTETWNLTSEPGLQDFFPSVVVTPNGRVHVVFMHSEASQTCSFATNTTSTWIATSDDNGTSFSEPHQISEQFSTNSGEMLYYEMVPGVSYTDDAVFPVWTDHRDNHPVPYSASMLTSTISARGGLTGTMCGIPHFLDSYNKADVFPDVSPEAVLIYTGSEYEVAPDPLQDDVGYLVEFPYPVLQRFYGTWKDIMPMPVHEGWNIIGSISSPVKTDDIIEDPSNIVDSYYFGIDEEGGYGPVERLIPGRGYWVQTVCEGTLTLPYEYNSPALPRGTNDPLLGADMFTVVDSAGRAQRLLVSAEGRRVRMPPDRRNKTGLRVRFLSGYFHEIVSEFAQDVELPIALDRVKYPVTFKWRTKQQNGISYWIRDGNVRIPLDTSGSMVIRVRGDDLIKLEAKATSLNKPRAVGIPTEFHLENAFPNPFNPNTEIRYNVSELSRVSVIITDVLGRTVTTLVNRTLLPGKYSETWNGTNSKGESVSSGIYILNLRAVDGSGAVLYSKTDKLLLMK